MKTSALMLTMLFLLSVPLSAASIHGRVTAQAAKKKPDGGGYSRGVFMPTPAKQEGKQEMAEADGQDLVVIWAEPLDARAVFIQPEKKPLMMQQGKKFVPAVLAVQKGTTVGFPNLDPIYHNVFSYSRAKRFDLGRYAEGKSKDVTFDENGVIEVFCEIHETMHAYILVVDTPYFTLAPRNADYSIQAPPGRYRVKAWAPNQESEPQQIMLGASTDAKVDFSL
jgi:plastocyanin